MAGPLEHDHGEKKNTYTQREKDRALVRVCDIL